MVKELQNNNKISDIFLLKKKEILKTKNNDNYLSVVLSDCSGDIEGKLWRIGENSYNDLTEGKPVVITGRIDKFKDKLQINIEKISCLNNPSEEILNSLIPSTDKDISKLYQSILSLKNSLTNKYLIKLIDKVLFKDKEFSDKFKLAPAASKLHHAYRGGLLEHTLSVTRLCDMFSKKYPEINRDLILTGALLHDIGKVEEYDNITFKRTTTGKLLGHISIGVVSVDRKISTIKNFPDKLEQAVKHLILSHHGELEWGSPVQPCTVEAVMLHYADNIDSKIETFSDRNSEKTGWQYNKSLRRDVLLEDYVEEEIFQPDSTKEKQKKIKTLFD